VISDLKLEMDHLGEKNFQNKCPKCQKQVSKEEYIIQALGKVGFNPSIELLINEFKSIRSTRK